MDTDRVILVVEDQSAERESLLRFLRSEHYTAYGAQSGDAALAHLDGGIDLVLSDVRLGASMSGIDLLKIWKHRRPATPFILITGFADIGSAVDAVKAGAEDYLVKPVSPTGLLQKISAALHAARKPNGGMPTHVPLDQLERAAIEQTLLEYEGNRTRTAKALGISVRTLQRKLRAWNADHVAASNGSHGATS